MTFSLQQPYYNIDPTTTVVQNITGMHASLFTLINILVNDEFDQQFLNLFELLFSMVLLV